MVCRLHAAQHSFSVLVNDACTRGTHGAPVAGVPTLLLHEMRTQYSTAAWGTAFQGDSKLCMSGTMFAMEVLRIRA